MDYTNKQIPYQELRGAGFSLNRPGNFFSKNVANIDYLAFYRTAVSATDAKNIANGTVAAPEAPALFWYSKDY